MINRGATKLQICEETKVMASSWVSPAHIFEPFESMLEMREVLTPEQRRQLADRINQRRQHFRDRMMR